MEDLLALGTVVEIATEEGNREAVIIGYFPKNQETKKVYDYLTVIYPVGLDMVNAMQLVNRDGIVKVIAPGYLDEQAAAFVQAMPKVLGHIKKSLYEEIKEKALEAKAAAQAQAETPAEPHKPSVDEEFG